MPSWHTNMTAEDHERNLQDFRNEQRRDLAHAKARVRQWQCEVERLEAAVKAQHKEG